MSAHLTQNFDWQLSTVWWTFYHAVMSHSPVYHYWHPDHRLSLSVCLPVCVLVCVCTACCCCWCWCYTRPMMRLSGRIQCATDACVLTRYVTLRHADNQSMSDDSCWRDLFQQALQPSDATINQLYSIGKIIERLIETA